MKDTMENENKDIKEKGILKKIVGYIDERRLFTKLKIGLHQVPEKDDQTIRVLPTSSNIDKKGHGTTHVVLPDELKDSDEKVTLFTGYIIEKTKEKEEEQKKKEDQKDNKKGKLKFILLPIILAGVISLNSCSATQQVVETKVTPIEWEYMNTKNPSAAAHGMQQAEGQETQYNGVNGYGDYDSEKAYQDEYIASENSVEYDDLKREVIEQFEQAEMNPGDDRGILEGIEEKIEGMDKIYEGLESDVKGYVEGFVEETNKHSDANTVQEIETMNIAYEEFEENAMLAEENVNGINEITSKRGELQIDDIEVKADGDVVITGRQIEQIVKQEKVKGLKAIKQNIKEFFQNLIQGNSRKDNNQR